MRYEDGYGGKKYLHATYFAAVAFSVAFLLHFLQQTQHRIWHFSKNGVAFVAKKKSNKNATDTTENVTAAAKNVARRYFLPPQPSSYLISIKSYSKSEKKIEKKKNSDFFQKKILTKKRSGKNFGVHTIHTKGTEIIFVQKIFFYPRGIFLIRCCTKSMI